MAIAVSEALTRLEGRIQAPLGTFWAQQEGLYALTEALRVWQALTGAIEGSVALAIKAGEPWLVAPHQLLSASRVKTENGVPLTQYSTTELDMEFGDWENVTPGTPKYWAPDGMRMIALYPRPSTDMVLVVDGPLDVPLLTLSDTMDVGAEDLTRVLAYAQSPYLSFKEMPGELNTDSLGLMAQAAGGRNAELRNSSFYRRYAGMDRLTVEKQEGDTEVGKDLIGGRQ